MQNAISFIYSSFRSEPNSQGRIKQLNLEEISHFNLLYSVSKTSGRLGILIKLGSCQQLWCSIKRVPFRAFASEKKVTHPTIALIALNFVLKVNLRSRQPLKCPHKLPNQVKKLETNSSIFYFFERNNLRYY